MVWLAVVRKIKTLQDVFPFIHEVKKKLKNEEKKLNNTHD